MGVYYKIVCDALKESIDPGELDDCGVKLGSIAYPGHPLGMVTIHALSSRWMNQSCRLANDSGGDDEAYSEYRDVTEVLVTDFNARYHKETPVKFTPWIRKGA